MKSKTAERYLENTILSSKIGAFSGVSLAGLDEIQNALVSFALPELSHESVAQR